MVSGEGDGSWDASIRRLRTETQPARHDSRTYRMALNAVIDLELKDPPISRLRNCFHWLVCQPNSESVPVKASETDPTVRSMTRVSISSSLQLGVLFPGCTSALLSQGMFAMKFSTSRVRMRMGSMVETREVDFTSMTSVRHHCCGNN